MKLRLWLAVVALAVTVPALAEPTTAVIQGKLPAGMTVRLDAEYLSRIWKPAVQINPALPIPVAYKSHFSKSFSTTAVAGKDGTYRLEFPLEIAGRLTKYRLDASRLTFSRDGKTFNLPTWFVPTYRASKTLGRANLAVSDVVRLVVERQGPSVDVTRIAMNDGKVYTGHVIGFPESADETPVATLDIESSATGASR